MSSSDDAIQMSILVVDDDPKIRSSVAKFLKAQGHQVCEAGGGSEGLAALRAEPMDIVITDVRMPGMDGFEVLREVRRVSPGTEVIMITAFNDVENAFRAMREGAFTDAREDRKGYFELADGGTLFMDEIGDMDLSMQAKLLRTLETRRIRPVGGSREVPVDVRVVSATNRDLPRAVADGRFREDLLYRLNAFTIRTPPLRERPEDILPLSEHILVQYARELRKPIAGFAPEVAVLLRAHPFPGNVRELRNLVERAAIVCKGDRVMPEDLELIRSVTPGSPEGEAESAGPGDLRRVVQAVPSANLKLDAFEREIVREALRRCGGNQVRAAELLRVSRTILRRRIARYRIDVSEFSR
jgi:DNA-binding NtrC family response regulator